MNKEKILTGRAIMRAEPLGQLVTRLWNPSATYSGLDHTYISVTQYISKLVYFCVFCILCFAHVKIGWKPSILALTSPALSWEQFLERKMWNLFRVALFYIFLDYPDISNCTSVFEEWGKITSIPSRMMLVSAKDGQIQTWWFFLDIFSFEQMLIPTFTPNFQLWPVFLEKFSSRIYIRENRDILQLLHQQQEDNELTTRTRVSLKNLPHGHQTYHTNTSLLQNLWVGKHPGESHHLGRIWQFLASAFHLVKSQKNVESPRVLQQSRSSRRISHGLGSNSTNHQSASYRYGSTQLKCGI